MDITMAIYEKWPSAPQNVSELSEFLKRKGLEVDSIGTSKEAIESWIQQLKCRDQQTKR